MKKSSKTSRPFAALWYFFSEYIFDQFLKKSIGSTLVIEPDIFSAQYLINYSIRYGVRCKTRVTLSNNLYPYSLTKVCQILGYSFLIVYSLNIPIHNPQQPKGQSNSAAPLDKKKTKIIRITQSSQRCTMIARDVLADPIDSLADKDQSFQANKSRIEQGHSRRCHRGCSTLAQLALTTRFRMFAWVLMCSLLA